MASTLSGQGKGSRGVIHLQNGDTIGVSACGRGTRTVTFAGRKMVSCKKCKELSVRREREIEELAAEKLARLIQKSGLTKLVRERYDGAQGNADAFAKVTVLDEYVELEKAGKVEEAQEFAHNHGIEAVWMLLVDKGLMSGEDVSATVVELAYHQIS